MARIALDTGSIRGIGAVVARGPDPRATAWPSPVPATPQPPDWQCEDRYGEAAADAELHRLLVTHDVKSLHAVYDRVAALVDGRIAALGPLQSVLASDHGAMIPPKATLEGEVVELGVAGKTNDERARCSSIPLNRRDLRFAPFTTDNASAPKRSQEVTPTESARARIKVAPPTWPCDKEPGAGGEKCRISEQNSRFRLSSGPRSALPCGS